jgi:hypothetical protein
MLVSEFRADAVDGEPADTGDDGVETGRQRVAEPAERDAREHHLRHAVLGAAGREHRMGERAEAGTDQDREGRLAERETEDSGGQHAQEDGGELEVGGEPGPEQLQGIAVPLARADELRASGLDRDDLGAVLAGAYLGDDCL